MYRGLLLRSVVGRSRQCLDYSCTMYGIHLLLCILCYGYATVLTNVLLLASLMTQCAVTVVIGRWWCQRTELLPIPLSTYEPILPSRALPIYTRIRFCLPFFTRQVARLIGLFKANIENDDETIQLNKMPSMPLTLQSSLNFKLQFE